MTIETKPKEKETDEMELEQAVLQQLSAMGVDLKTVTPEMMAQVRESVKQLKAGATAVAPSVPADPEDPKAARAAFIREAISQLMPMVGIIQAQLATLATQEQIKTVNVNIGTVIKRLNALETRIQQLK